MIRTAVLALLATSLAAAAPAIKPTPNNIFGLEVPVGPVAAHNTTAAHVATFDEYALKPAKPEEKK